MRAVPQRPLPRPGVRPARTSIPLAIGLILLLATAHALADPPPMGPPPPPDKPQVVSASLVKGDIYTRVVLTGDGGDISMDLILLTGDAVISFSRAYTCDAMTWGTACVVLDTPAVATFVVKVVAVTNVAFDLALYAE